MFNFKKKNDGGSEVSQDKWVIEVNNVVGNTTSEVQEPFLASREADENGVVWLVGKGFNFGKELYPTEENYQKYYGDSETIKKRIVVLKSKITKLRNLTDKNSETSKENILDYEKELKELERALRRLKYSSDSSFIKFDYRGRKKICFLRKGTNFLPMKTDTSTSTIFIPTDVRLKNIALERHNKNWTYSQSKRKLEGRTTAILLFIIFIMSLANVWGFYKNFSAYDDSNIAELERRSLENLNQCNLALKETAGTLQSVTEDLKNVPFQNNIVEGSIPRTIGD